jgi:hypothetical protein
MKETFLKMLEMAKAEGLTFADLCRRFLQSNGNYQSLVKDFIIRSGRVPDVGPVAQGAQAGFLILSQIEPENLNEFLELQPGLIPSKFRKYPFYNMAETSPGTFLSCLFLAGENPQLISNWDWLKEKTKQVQEGAKNLGEWAQKTVDNAADFVRDTAGKVADVGKKIVFAPFRGAFLILVRFNVFNFARRFDRGIIKDRQKVKNFWENEIGGDFAQLVSAVNLGKKEMPILPGKSSTFEPTTITAAIATATPIIAKASAFLAALGIVVKQGGDIYTDLTGKPVKDNEVQETIKNFEDKAKLIDENLKNVQAGTSQPQKDNTMLYVIGGAAVLLAILFIGRK